MGRYRIISFFPTGIKDSGGDWILPEKDNFATDLYDEQGNWKGWRIHSDHLGGGGSTEFFVKGIYDGGQETDLGIKVKTAEDGHLYCDIYLTNLGEDFSRLKERLGLDAAVMLLSSALALAWFKPVALAFNIIWAVAVLAFKFIGKLLKRWTVSYRQD